MAAAMSRLRFATARLIAAASAPYSCDPVDSVKLDCRLSNASLPSFPRMRHRARPNSVGREVEGEN